MNPMVMEKAAGIVKNKLNGAKKEKDDKPTLLTEKGRSVQGPPSKINYA